MRTTVHIYEVPSPGFEKYIGSTEATITNVFEDEHLWLQGTATIDGQQVPVDGGPSSGSHVWKHNKSVSWEDYNNG